MKSAFLGMALAGLVLPAAAEPLTEYTMRDTGQVAPGLQYTVTGRDGSTVTVIEGQPRWNSQHRTDSRLVPGGTDVTVINNLRRLIHRQY